MCAAPTVKSLPRLQGPSPLLIDLFTRASQYHEFLKRTHAYNCAFQMLSFGANIIRDGHLSGPRPSATPESERVSAANDANARARPGKDASKRRFER